MKKNIYFIIAGLFAIAFLFSSCKSLTNFSIEKRQHRGGYYVDWGNGKVKTDEAKSSAVKSRRPNASLEQNQVAVSGKSKVSPENATNIEKTDANDNQGSVTKSAAKRSYTHNSFKVKEAPVSQHENVNLELLRSFEYTFNDGQSAETSNDTPRWVLAVLCILLPPLAVFLKFGIGTEFWISVILTLIFWLPGVIYAFVVIFG